MQEPIAYKGTEPYIFVSYPHRKKDVVLPIIAQLQADGFRIWYDEGIDPGTEWNEYIAQHINDCRYFIAFICQEFLDSRHCRNELGWAASREKERVLVFLEDVKLPDGIAIQENLIQHIHWYTYKHEQNAYARLYETKGIAPCHQEGRPPVLERIPEERPGGAAVLPHAVKSENQTSPGFSAGYNYGQAGQSSPQSGPQPSYRGPGLPTNRSLLTYILLTLVTCGIYGLYFFYKMARDVNTVCEGDGRHTQGLVVFLLLTSVTCGLYAFYWYYALGNRLADNAPRYGMTFQENGTTILLWEVLGSLLCCIGPFVAMHIIFKNLNSLCYAYNQYNGLA